MENQFEKPKCQLVGEDGNAFTLIGIVSSTLRKASLKEQAKEFIERAYDSESYNELLVIISEYVEIE